MNLPRRSLLRAASALAFPFVLRSEERPVLGQGEFRYRVVPGWGALGADTPVKNCHGIVTDREGHIVLLTDHVKNNVIVYDPSGKLVHKWGTEFPGAHGLTIVTENGREVLYLTDLSRHRVFKTTLDGTVLAEWGWPQASGKYANEGEYKPSWTLHLPDGGFFILDGYGKDYITRHAPDGTQSALFGGPEGGIAHWGPHGGMVDARDPAKPNLLIAMSDQQHLLRLDLEGKKLGITPLPGGNPRQIRAFGEHFVVAHLADNWPADRNSRGFVSVLDANLRVVSNLAGTAPEYDDTGALRKMRRQEEVFLHPHDLVADRQGDLYVAQFASGNTVPVKLERV